MNRKFLSFFMAGMLGVSLVPTTAFAAQEPIADLALDDVQEIEVLEELPAVEQPQQPEQPESETLAAPEPIANLQATAELDSITLTWTKASAATKYAIYRSTSPNAQYVKIKTVGNIDTYEDEGLDINVMYYYKVIPFNGSVRGEASNVVQVRTGLEKPVGIAAERQSHTSIKLTWEPVPESTKYVVYRSFAETGEPYTKLLTVKATEYLDIDLETGLDYYYKVLPFAGDKRGQYSDVVTAKTTMDKLTGLAAKANDDGTINVTWTETPGADLYKVYRSTREDGGSKLVATIEGTTFVDRAAEEKVTYYYKVSPQCGMMNGGAVGPVSATAINGEIFKNIVEIGRSLIGTPYRRGGKTPSGFDCSGFVWYVLKESGYDTNYKTSSEWRGTDHPTFYDWDDMQPGDILCFTGHVSIYIGDGMMIDSGNGGVREITVDKPYWRNSFRCIKRIL